MASSASPSQSAEASAAQNSAPTGQPDANLDSLVLEYLRARGHSAAAEALQNDSGANSIAGPSTIDSARFARELAKFSNRPEDEEIEDASEPGTLQLLASVAAVGAEEILSSDPTDKYQGFRELEAWVDGSLDMYRPEFRPILYPIFCHFYLDLVEAGYRESAQAFYRDFSSSLAPTHQSELHHISNLLLPMHVQQDELAQRFRDNKYTVRMSRSGFGLLVGWLTEGMGGEVTGAGTGFSGEKGKRGRSAVMRVVNNHLRFDVTTASTTSVAAKDWEESTGLLSALLPRSANDQARTSQDTFNQSQGHLKLGPLPLHDDLLAEAERTMQQEAAIDPANAHAQYDLQNLRPVVPPGTMAPGPSDLPPHPPGFRLMDMRREIERARDARKRIRLEPSMLGGMDPASPQSAAVRPRALPSVCAYTMHDVAEGVPCATFSADNSLMVAGFSESYVRLWSLNGEKLRGMRSDFQPSSIKDSAGVRRLKEKGGSTTRKLIGHSGPVYSVAFDPSGGSTVPPRALLSASADGTTRLWSIDTLTNIVAYRGHQNPVWDVQWSPLGTYFATGSRDRTARLWSTDRTATMRIYAGHLSDVDCVRFHPNSVYLATGSSDWTSRLWDVQTGTCVRAFIGHQGNISTMAFSPDGRYLATAGEDLSINLWDLGSGKRVKKMIGHTSSVYSLAFSAESSLLVSGGSDWTVRCWDVKSAGGMPTKPRENGVMTNGANGHPPSPKDDSSLESVDLLTTFPTKRTPIINVQFTSRNLCLVAGPYLPPEQRI